MLSSWSESKKQCSPAGIWEVFIMKTPGILSRELETKMLHFYQREKALNLRGWNQNLLLNMEWNRGFVLAVIQMSTDELHLLSSQLLKQIQSKFPSIHRLCQSKPKALCGVGVVLCAARVHHQSEAVRLLNTLSHVRGGTAADFCPQVRPTVTEKKWLLKKYCSWSVYFYSKQKS